MKEEIIEEADAIHSWGGHLVKTYHKFSRMEDGSYRIESGEWLLNGNKKTRIENFESEVLARYSLDAFKQADAYKDELALVVRGLKHDSIIKKTLKNKIGTLICDELKKLVVEDENSIGYANGLHMALKIINEF